MPRRSQIIAQDRTRGSRLQKLRAQVFAAYGYECWLCGRDGADTIDHIVALSVGGDDSLDNLRPAHGRKSATCPGNYSRRRSLAPPTRPIEPRSSVAAVDGITYGDGWIRKQRGNFTSTMFYEITGKSIDDPFVQSWINT